MSSPTSIFGTLEVLQRTGVSSRTRRLSRSSPARARGRRGQGVVRIPPHVVEDAIRSAPSKVLLAGRNPSNDIVLEPGRVGFTNFGEGVLIVDPFTGEVRDPTKQDVADTAKVVDELPDVDVYERAVAAHDVSQARGRSSRPRRG